MAQSLQSPSFSDGSTFCFVAEFTFQMLLPRLYELSDLGPRKALSIYRSLAADIFIIESLAIVKFKLFLVLWMYGQAERFNCIAVYMQNCAGNKSDFVS